MPPSSPPQHFPSFGGVGGGGGGGGGGGKRSLLKRVLWLGLVGASAGAFGAAWWYRPIFLKKNSSSSSTSTSSSSEDNSSDTSDSSGSNSGGIKLSLAALKERERLADLNKVAKIPALNNAEEPPNIFYDFASHIVVFAVVNVSRLLHALLRGKIDLQLDENYYNFLAKLKYREQGKALITVSNHRSLLDDPSLLGCMIPYFTIIRPKFARYTLCASDYCFKPEIPALIHGLLEAGHTFPLQRGAGIDQYHLLNFARHVASGDWCHIFPEGGIWQLDELGGRLTDSNKTLGKLKWGVGKLIAHAPTTPVVLPFFHMGIETTLPQNPVTKLCRSLIPNPNHRVDILFGSELRFDDLIEEHEQKYGKLWKYAPKATDSDNMEQELKMWKSQATDKILYHKITLRIQAALENLNEDMIKLRERKGRKPFKPSDYGYDDIKTRK